MAFENAYDVTPPKLPEGAEIVYARINPRNKTVEHYVRTVAQNQYAYIFSKKGNMLGIYEAAFEGQ